MNTANLIIVPGLSSPLGEYKHRSAYQLLIEEAATRGYREVKLLVMPGQRREDGSACGELSLPAAVEHLAKLLVEHEDRKVPYRLLGLSFGATVCLAAESQLDLRHCERIALWGPVPYWLAWQAFVGGVARSKLGSQTQLVPDLEFFQALVPVEHFVGLHPRKRSPLRLAAGSADRFCPPFYLEYLRQHCLFSGRDNVEVREIADCPHTVSRDVGNWSQYVEAVLD